MGNTNTTVVAVVVTYNRLPLLKRTIGCLLAQTHALSRIVVVNNGSTDGTHEWLSEQTETRLHTVEQANVGGSGGFYRGMQEALALGAQWVWCMDDDVFPRPECLEHLLPYTADNDYALIAPRRLLEGAVFTNDFTGYDLTHPFRSLYTGKLRKLPVQPTSPTEIAGTAFEGPLISAEAIKHIGLPRKELFIFCDDTDYCLRLKRAGYRLLYVPAALMDKHRFFSNDTWAERTRKKRWKRLYQVRNATFINHHYGCNWGVRHLRSFNTMLGYWLIALVTCPFSKAYCFSDLSKLWKAYKDGVNERLGTKHYNE